MKVSDMIAASGQPTPSAADMTSGKPAKKEELKKPTPAERRTLKIEYEEAKATATPANPAAPSLKAHMESKGFSGE